jgi:transcriptional regulator with XRE-family HTH domain
MNPHKIYELLASRRRELGLSQQELADRVGMRREKVNRIESQRIEIGLGEISRLLDVVGLVISVEKKPGAKQSSSKKALNSHGLEPGDFESASFFDGSRAKVIDWGKIPR